MTICIVGIAENKKIIAISDKMLTLGVPIATTFEISENDKVIKLAEKTVALFAGEVITANEILNILKEKINEDSSISSIANETVNSYREYFRKMISENIFERFGIKLDYFIKNQKKLDDEFVRRINNIIMEAKIGVEIIVAGIESEVPHIYGIYSPGIKRLYDSIGYHSIGSGSQHATLSLIESEYQSSIDESGGIYAVLQAKKRAEYDPGVGKLCDIVLINEDGLNRLTTEKISEINKDYNLCAEKIQESKKKCSQIIIKKIENNE